MLAAFGGGAKQGQSQAMFLSPTVLLTSVTQTYYYRKSLTLVFRSSLSHFFNETQQKFCLLKSLCVNFFPSLWLVDCKYWRAGVCDHHNKLTVGSSIAVLHSLQYHLSTMDLWRLMPVGLGDVHTASLKGWHYRAGGGVSAQLKLFSHLHTQNRVW